MAPFAIGSGCSIMLSEHGLDVFDVPRSIFDELPGFECERSDAGNGQRFYVRHGTVSDTIQVTFYCNQPPAPRALVIDQQSKPPGLIPVLA